MSSNTRPRFSGSDRVMPPPGVRARYVATKVIQHARHIKYPDEHRMCCPDCQLFPVLPVTGPCGHTRCTMCIEGNRTCPCGAIAYEDRQLNFCIQDLLSKMLHSHTSKRRGSSYTEESSTPSLPEPSSTSSEGSQDPLQGPERIRRQSRLIRNSTTSAATKAAPVFRQPVPYQVRYKYARDLVAMGKYWEAAPHLAHVAANADAEAKVVGRMLAQVITILSEERDPRHIMRDLYRSVREQSYTAWLKTSDLECVICYQVLRRPVTTPCGHTFCRTCIERTLHYNKRCALCSQSLDNFNVAQTADTMFISAALAAIGAVIPPCPLESGFIPIFSCTVAYPAMPCPLLIFDPRYWAMIRRVLESGTRRFGMVAFERDRSFSDYGTILEVRDCVQFEDGRSILSTVGLTRFRIIERDVADGCLIARIEELSDLIPTATMEVWDVRLLAQQILYKAVLWLSSLDQGVMSDIEATFGPIPQYEHEPYWWENLNGPAWLWWLIAILPLRSEIQVLMLSTKHLMKRMLAVSRTLDLMDHVSLTPGCQVVMSAFSTC